MENIKKEEKLICAICGNEIIGKPNEDHFIPKAVYKWAIDSENNKKAEKLIEKDNRNIIYTCEKCNYIKQDKILTIDKLHLDAAKKQDLKDLQDEIQDEINLYVENKKYIAEKQEYKCYNEKCKRKIKNINKFVLRRIKKKDELGIEMPRALDNCKALCWKCNAKGDKKLKFYKK